MNQRHFPFLPLLLSTCVLLQGSEAWMEVTVDAGRDALVPCVAEAVGGVTYREVRWYKVRDDQVSGLVSRKLPGGQVRYYSGLNRQVELLNQSQHLLLPNVTCQDGGVYLCSLAPPARQEMRQGQVFFYVAGCSDGSIKDVTTESVMVISASAVLILAFLIFFISYVCLRSVPQDRDGGDIKAVTALDAPLAPLDKKDLESLYTLGPKPSKMKMVRV